MSPSTFEILPDEILLNICRYLLCSDILYSFMGLNNRLTRMIAQYRYHLSFHKTTIKKFDYLCTKILPQIGWQIRSLYIDCCYSVLQDRVFLKYFQENISIIFPNLQRISLISYSHDQLVPLINILHDLHQLTEIRLYSLFSISLEQQPDFARLLFQANDHRLTTILIDNASTALSFHKNDCYLNIIDLSIRLDSMADLTVLFAAIPNVRRLDVIVDTRESLKEKNYVITASPLHYLVDFSLRSIIHSWNIIQLMILLEVFPNVERLSFLLYTKDRRLTYGNSILPLVPSTVKQFNYIVYLCSPMISNEYETIIASWPSSKPIACFYNENFLFLHTIPWYVSRLEMPSSIGKSISHTTINMNGYEKYVERVCLYVNQNFSLNKSLMIISQCFRAREIIINITDDIDILKDEQLSISQMPVLSRVVQIYFNGFALPTIKYYSIILHALPNLFRLDLSFACLLRLVEDPSICSILNERILSLCIGDNDVNTTAPSMKEEHISMIASVFRRVGDLYIDISHLTSSPNKISSNDYIILEEENIVPLSSESFLLCLLKTFQINSLYALCIDGKFNDHLKINAEQWLQTNSILSGQRFTAVFDKELDRLLIWM